MALCVARFDGIPREMDRRLFIDAMLGSRFMLYHDLEGGDTLVVSDDPGRLAALPGAMPGVKLVDAMREFRMNEPIAIVAYAMPDKDAGREEPPALLDDLYDVLSGSESGVFMSFMPSDPSHVRKARERVENELSRTEVRQTKSVSDRAFHSSSNSLQVELYYDSEKRAMLLSMLDMLNDASHANGTAYKVCIVIEDAAFAGPILRYLGSKLLLLDQFGIGANDLDALFRKLADLDAMPFSYDAAARMLAFSGFIKKNDVVDSYRTASDGDILIGEYLKGSMAAGGKPIGLRKDIFNLGTIVTGVPGTGKTAASMHIMRQIIKRVQGAVIISPTGEWNSFGSENGMHIVNPYKTDVPINFFKCDSSINIERFYENMAMLVASASVAGPYKNSMEKCLLAAFNKVYLGTRSPSPVDVYDEIEEALIEQHGKRTATGVRYTKHGENVRAALESLRLMLLKPQFACAEGVNFGELLRRGVVFDLSDISNNLKPFFYALILNQAYGFTDALGVDGDNDLRIMMCLEESQLVFENGDQQSAAVIDLKQRIQDFRKKGVGLFLITHSITDVPPSIRRLCQIKLYFRQNPDIAKVAASDLMLDADMDIIVGRLRNLEQRTCALTLVELKGGRKDTSCSTFVRIPEYSPVRAVYVPPAELGARVRTEDMVIRVIDAAGTPVQGAKANIFAFGERVLVSSTDENGSLTLKSSVPGNRYKLILPGKRRSDAREFSVIGGRCNVVAI